MSKKKNFLLFALMLGALLAFPLIGCGGDDDEGGTPSGGGGGNQDDAGEVNAANWQSVLQSTYGVDLSTPAGWTFSEAKDLTINDNYPEHEVYFTTQEADFQAAYQAFVEHLFAATEAVTPADGNYGANSLWPFEKGDRFETVPFLETWYFTHGDAIIQVVANDSESSKKAGFSIMRTASTKNW